MWTSVKKKSLCTIDGSATNEIPCISRIFSGLPKKRDCNRFQASSWNPEVTQITECDIWLSETLIIHVISVQFGASCVLSYLLINMPPMAALMTQVRKLLKGL